MSDPTNTNEAQPPQVLIILMDNPSTGELEIGGIQRPLEFNPQSPAHVVGKFLAEHMHEVIAAAQSVAAVNKPDVGESIIGPDRERTIVGVPV